MNRHLLAALVASAAFATPAVAHQPEKAPAEKTAAQPGATQAKYTVDPAAAKLLAESTAAVKALKDVSGTSVQSAGGATSKGAFSVAIPAKISGFPLSMYVLTTSDAQGKPVTQWSSDGSQIQKLDHGSKTLLTYKIEKGQQTMPPSDSWGVMPQWIFEELMDNPQIVLVGAKQLADAEVGGVKCHVVEQVREFDPGEEGVPKMKIVATRTISIDDKLPRRIELSADNPGGENYKMTVEMTDLKANQGLTATNFVLAAPEGYTAKNATAEEVGVQVDTGAASLAVSEGSDFPAFSLKDADGKEVTLASLKGQVVLLDFWATWCGPCKAAMPKIQALHEKYKGKTVTIAGVNCWEQKPENAPKYMASKNYTYSLLMGGDDLAKKLNISGIPTLILISKDGKVLHTSVGFSPSEEEELSRLIDAQLAAK